MSRRGEKPGTWRAPTKRRNPNFLFLPGIAIAIGLLAIIYIDQRTRDGQRSEEKIRQKLDRPIRVQAKEISRQFSTDPEGSGRRYVDRTIVLSGNVSNTATVGNSELLVTFDVGRNAAAVQALYKPVDSGGTIRARQWLKLACTAARGDQNLVDLSGCERQTP